MNNKTKKNLLVTLAGKNYIKQAKQLFSSVYWNAGWKGDYMLLSYKIPEKELKWFKKKGILIKKCILSSKHMHKRWPSVVLNKFYLFRTELKKWKNIVYLDGDIIVRDSLDKLTKIKGLAAVKSHKKLLNLCLKPLHIKLEKRDFSKLKELKKRYDLTAEAFNAGVLAFSTDTIKDYMFKKANSLSNYYRPICATGDELITNLLFYKKWKKLPQIYNIYPDYITYLYSIKPQNIKGIVLHFVLNKPWNKKSPFYNEWKNNLEKAELINLKNPQKPAGLPKQEIKIFLMNLKKRRIIYFLKKIAWEINRAIDRHIGLAGIFLKNNHPKSYYKLKNTSKKVTWNPFCKP